MHLASVALLFVFGSQILLPRRDGRRQVPRRRLVLSGRLVGANLGLLRGWVRYTCTNLVCCRLRVESASYPHACALILTYSLSRVLFVVAHCVCNLAFNSQGQILGTTTCGNCTASYYCAAGSLNVLGGTNATGAIRMKTRGFFSSPRGSIVRPLGLFLLVYSQRIPRSPSRYLDWITMQAAPHSCQSQHWPARARRRPSMPSAPLRPSTASPALRSPRRPHTPTPPTRADTVFARW